MTEKYLINTAYQYVSYWVSNTSGGFECVTGVLAGDVFFNEFDPSLPPTAERQSPEVTIFSDT